MAMARAAGFDAVPMDVAQRDEIFTQSLPDSSSLEEIVTVTLGGKQRYFDPGTAFLPFGMLAWDNAGSTGVRYPKKAEAAWLDTPGIASKDARRERIADLKLDGDVLTGTVKLIEHGHEGLSRRWALIHSDDAESKKTIEDEVKAWFPEGSTVKMTKLTGTKDAEQPVVAELDVTITGLGSAAGSRFLLPMSVFTSQRKNIFSAQKRTMDIFFKHAYETTDRVTVTLPDDHVIEPLPLTQNFNYGALRFTNEWKKDGKSVTLTRTQVVDTSFIPLDRYTSVRNFFSKVLTADQDPIVLKVGDPVANK
jgi:hypothetical protein